jgi:hypothetical protein
MIDTGVGERPGRVGNEARPVFDALVGKLRRSRWRRWPGAEGAVRVHRRAGQHQHAATVARSITNPDRPAQTLATVAEALAARGERDRHATWLRWRVPSDGGQWRWCRCCRWNRRRLGCSPTVMEAAAGQT